MPALETITVATSTSADVLRQAELIGSIQPGCFADIIAVPRDPLTDISVMGRVDFVMYEGVACSIAPTLSEATSRGAWRTQDRATGSNSALR